MDLEFRCEFQGGQPVWTNEYSQQPRVWKVCTATPAPIMHEAYSPSHTSQKTLRQVTLLAA